MATADATGDTLDLTWDASTDNVGVAGYEVLVTPEGDETATSTKTDKTAATVGGLTGGTTYTVKVRAFDAFGNHSFWSKPVTATTT